MFKRKIDFVLQEWKDNPNHKPLVIKGVRQCGKTSSVLAFAKSHYKNVLADILGKMGKKLYYFQKPDSIEIDFVMRYKGECMPLECKAKTGNAKSLKTLLKHPEKYHVYHALKVGDYNVGRNDQTLTLPFYMAFMLNEV